MTRRKRWSEHLEAQRGGAETAAREAAERIARIERLGECARELILNNPALAREYLAEIVKLAAQVGSRQERIVRLMVEAANGLNSE